MKNLYKYIYILYSGTESNDVINKRVDAASREIEKSKELGVYTEIVNDQLD